MINWVLFFQFSANEFPSSFESIVRKILRLLYHVVAHIYHCHFREVALLGLHVHLNCVFAHLTLLNQRFNLIDPKETEILGDLEAALLGMDDLYTSYTRCILWKRCLINSFCRWLNTRYVVANFVWCLGSTDNDIGHLKASNFD